MPDMTLNGLKEEFQELRLFKGLFFAPLFFATLLNPEPLPQGGSLSHLFEKVDEVGHASFKPEDEKMMDLRRRVLDIFTEASNLDLI